MTETQKAALVVVDFQEDFCPPNGTLPIAGGRDIAPTINNLLSRPFALKIATRDFHPPDHISFAKNHEGKEAFTSSHTIQNPENADETQTTLLWPPHCIQSTPGVELLPELDTSKIDLIVDKGQDKRVESYSAFGPPFRNPRFGATELDAVLKKAAITHVFVVGLAFDFCVKHTAIDAAQHGFITYVVEDASRAGSQGEESARAARKEMSDQGVHLITSNSKDLDVVAIA